MNKAPEYQKIWEQQGKILRDPKEIFGASYDHAMITRQSLYFKTSPSFAQILYKRQATIFVSREYENLLVAFFSPDGHSLVQTYFHVPHPSGIAVDADNQTLYIASTRNPNQIFEFHGAETTAIAHTRASVLLPTRAKFYPGSYYFHDLSFIQKSLYANAVGLNAIIKVDLSKSTPDIPVWWPRSIENSKGRPQHQKNFIQLNSIAAGATLKDSFFTASGEKIGKRLPGQKNYLVRDRGVVFSGRNREVIARGLTRPHSARLSGERIWLANSGFGTVGYIHSGVYRPVLCCDAWTRGLCFLDNRILLAGTSRILPRFEKYAPGVDPAKARCAVHAFDIKTETLLGSLAFPYGNQIFSIAVLYGSSPFAFPYTKARYSTRSEKSLFYQSNL